MNDYVVVRKDGHGMSMSHPMKMGDTVWFEVQHTDGMTAWSSNTFWADAAKRSINGLRLQASKMCLRYQAHLDRTGERFEVEEKRKKDAAWLAKKKTERIAWLERNIPKLQRELEAAQAGAEFNLRDGKFEVQE